MKSRYHIVQVQIYYLYHFRFGETQAAKKLSRKWKNTTQMATHDQATKEHEIFAHVRLIQPSISMVFNVFK